ncbi:MAG: hypothetical protein P1S46_07610 [bacterium]|nr:hypothetical protein [bacterium]MDT8396956.1 hypothetical protein [bacterium]
MKTFIIVIIVIVAAWLALMLGLKLAARVLRKGAVKAAGAALAGETVRMTTDNASYLGADFPGPNLPPRTSGVLAVTDTKLFFLPWFPRKAITLPRATIAEVSLKGSFRDMSYSIPLLTIKVRGVGDPHGTMTWLVHDPAQWEREIRSILK